MIIKGGKTRQVMLSWKVKGVNKMRRQPGRLALQRQEAVVRGALPRRRWSLDIDLHDKKNQLCQHQKEEHSRRNKTFTGWRVRMSLVCCKNGTEAQVVCLKGWRGEGRWGRRTQEPRGPSVGPSEQRRAWADWALWKDLSGCCVGNSLCQPFLIRGSPPTSTPDTWRCLEVFGCHNWVGGGHCF